MSLKADFKKLLTPYFIFNIILSLSYIIFKRTPVLCNYLFNMEDCEFDGRETEILFFLIIVVMIRTRKAGNVSMINYLSGSFIYTKIANLILWFNADVVMGLMFAIIFILGALLFPEPTYSGPDNVVYFRGLQGVEEELARSPDTCWLITFYTAWNPGCVTFAPIFSELSNKYHLDNLRFGKVDVGRYPEAGRKFHINDSSLSKQLPTTILFREGKESARRPQVDSKGTVAKFFFSGDNVKGAFDLNNVYEQCKGLKKTSQQRPKKD